MSSEKLPKSVPTNIKTREAQKAAQAAPPPGVKRRIGEYTTKKEGTVLRSAISKKMLRANLERKKSITTLQKQIEEQKRKLKITQEQEPWIENKKDPSTKIQLGWSFGRIHSKVREKLDNYKQHLKPLNIPYQLIVNIFAEHVYNHLSQTGSDVEFTGEYSSKKFAFLKNLLKILQNAEKHGLNPKELLEQYSSSCGIEFYKNETPISSGIKEILNLKIENINASVSAFQTLVSKTIKLQPLQHQDREYKAKQANITPESFNPTEALRQQKIILKKIKFILNTSTLNNQIAHSISKSLHPKIRQKLHHYLKAQIEKLKPKEGSEITIETNGAIRHLSAKKVAERTAKALAAKKENQQIIKKMQTQKESQGGFWGFVSTATTWFSKVTKKLFGPQSFLGSMFRGVFNWFKRLF